MLPAAAAVVVGVWGVSLLVGHPNRVHARSSQAAKPTVRRKSSPVVLEPPPPFPGYLLIADRGNDRMLLVDGAKRIYWRYPRAGATQAMPFRFDDDTFFGPRADRIVSNQEDQNTIQIVSFPAGRVLWRFGHVNVRGSAPGYLHTPDDAYLLPDGLVSVADAYNCRVLFISPAHRIVRQYGSGICRHNPPSELGAINGATPLPGGGTLVSEINGSWIDDFARDGHLRWSVAAPVSYPSDPQLLAPNRILVADYTRPGAAIIITRTGRVLWRYGPTTGPGELDHPSLATEIAPGLVAITDDFRQRVVVVSLRTRRIVWQYGHTDVAGSRPGYLHTPDGLDLLATAEAQRQPAVRALLTAPRRRGTRPDAASIGSSSTPSPYRLAYRLPAPVEREVAGVSRGSIILAGGLDSSAQSTNGVFRLSPGSGRLVQLGTLPQPFHDAAGAVLGNRLLVFGGGASVSSAGVQAFDLRTNRGSVLAQLPHPLSDLASAVVGRTVYLVGGYDGRRPRGEIYRTTDGAHFELAGRLPVGLRYPAVATVGATIVVAGGIGPHGPTSSVYAFDTTTGRTRLLTRLPAPLAHATAVSSGGIVYVLGGVGSAAGVVKIDPRRSAATRLPGAVGVADVPAVVVAGRALLVGGDRAGRPVADVVGIRLP